jgi:hypothetical protein
MKNDSPESELQLFSVEEGDQAKMGILRRNMVLQKEKEKKKKKNGNRTRYLTTKPCQ